MALFQILYWQDIPSQVKAWDDFDEIKIDLGARFADRIDRVGTITGSDHRPTTISPNGNGAMNRSGRAIRKKLPMRLNGN